MPESEILRNLVVERDDLALRLDVARELGEKLRLKNKISDKNRLIESEDRKRTTAETLKDLRLQLRFLQEKRVKLIRIVNAKTDDLIERQQAYEAEVSRRAEAEIEANLADEQAPIGDDSTLRMQDEIRLCQSAINTATRQKAEIDAKLDKVNYKKGPLESAIAEAEGRWKDAVAACAEVAMLEAQVTFLPALALYIAATNWASSASRTSYEVKVSDEVLIAARDLLGEEIAQ